MEEKGRRDTGTEGGKRMQLPRATDKYRGKGVGQRFSFAKPTVIIDGSFDEEEFESQFRT